MGTNFKQKYCTHPSPLPKREREQETTLGALAPLLPRRGWGMRAIFLLITVKNKKAPEIV
jgi:hypothetical protein